MKYDFLIVGAGLFGASFVYNLRKYKPDAKILVVDKRNHIGGNCYTKDINGIQVHMYGAHIFRTNDLNLWSELCELTEMQPFINSPIAKVGDKLYNLPFNMNTFYQLFGAVTPNEAKEAIEKTIPKGLDNPQNLEEWVISNLGTVIYETLIKGYTEKQWGRKCTELPISIMRRLPIRYTFNNNYYNKAYQGVASSYTDLIRTMFGDVDFILNANGKDYINQADKVIYTGAIDEFFDYCLGKLDYRSVEFVHTTYNEFNVQGNAVINYTTTEVPYTRSIEHKHFYTNCDSDKSVVSYEFPSDTGEKAYPIEDSKNQNLYFTYLDKAKTEFPQIEFAGRLGEYNYYDMEETIIKAKQLVTKFI